MSRGPPFPRRREGRVDASATWTTIDRIGTDRHRLDSYTDRLRGEPVRDSIRTRRTGSRTSARRTATPTIRSTAIWLRGPYLHNGSVPTLRDLLDPPDQRPTVFYRGYDVFDQDEGRLRVDGAAADGQVLHAYDTSVPGNGNSGHVYGTTLPDADKRAIVEYMKTF